MNKTNEKELNRQLEAFIYGLFKWIGKLLKSIFYGIKKLNKKRNIILFFVSFLFTAGSLLLKDKIFSIDAPVYIHYLVYYTLLIVPVLYLIILGKTQDRSQEKYQKIFKEIGFSGQDSKFPFFVGSRVYGKKVILVFSSNIPLQDWKKAKERLETGMDCNILLIQEGKSKRLVELTTVPSSCQIPNRIDWSDEFIKPEDGVIVVGVGALEVVKFDLNRTPHILFAGETGSGKSVLLHVCLRQMIKKGCKVYMIDFKGGVEFGKKYEQFGEVITQRNVALAVLSQLVAENERRLTLFRDLEVKNLKEYNKKTGENLCRIGIFIDELAELLDKKGVNKDLKDVLEQLEGKLSTIARLSRATGINLFLGIQRPDANVLTGQIKNNIPVRVCGRFADKPASEIVLGNSMAVDLPDIKGRFLCKIGNDTVEFQAYYYDEDNLLINQDEEVYPEEKKLIRSQTKRRIKDDKKNISKKKAPKKEELITDLDPAGMKENPVDVMEIPDDIDFDEKIIWEPDIKNNNDFELDFDFSEEE